ncbi:MAG: hypothetical protein J3K34DRAFT_14016 [Monoraphidium minutum]|nr:MAG: hypothetical protein J3K34DRAFT_14016 [Monoraphidium minutum]
MASLFDDLPAPKARGEEGPQQQHASHEEAGVEKQRPEKRQRTEADAEAEAEAEADAEQHEQQQQQQQGGDDDAAPEAPPPPPPADQVGPALRKIANHISNPSKFPKAAGLLRQLLASGAVGAEHRAELFAALRAAFADPDRANGAALRREYRRLLNAFCNGVPPGVLAPAQGAHLEVYTIWTMQRGELATDDNFVFNKAVSRLKEDIAALGPATAAEEAAARGLQLPGGARVEGADAGAAVAAEEREEGEADEADPFGLNEVMRRNDEGQRRASEAGGSGGGGDGAWSAAELGVMRRQALLDCVTAAKAMHKLAWARTSVEMLVEAAHAKLDHFVAPQRAVLDDYLRWVKAERGARRSGASRAAGGGKELTSFEKARAEWATAAVSRYGKVGGAGDSKAAHWLG